MELAEDYTHYDDICDRCEHLLKTKSNNYPICKIGKFKEIDMTNNQCPHKIRE